MRNTPRVLLAFLALACFSAFPAAWAKADGSPPAPPAIGSAAGILIDADSGKVIWAKEDKTRRAPASLTKVLTAMVVLDNGDLDSKARVSPEATAIRGSRIMAREGWELNVRDLLWGLLLDSGNDAAIVLAQKTSPDGTVGGFMKMVNEKAAAIGALDTHFANPHGLDDPSHFSTARDLALMTRVAMQNPLFAEMVATPQRSVPWGEGDARHYVNHHKMVQHHPGTIGVKTGFTRGAGHCLITAVSRGNHTLIAVLLGSPAHYAETAALTDWGFAHLPALKQQSTDTVEIRRPPVPDPPAVNKAPELVRLTARGFAFLAGRPTPDGPMLPAAYAVLAMGFMSLLGSLSFFAYALIVRRRRMSPAPLILDMQRHNA